MITVHILQCTVQILQILSFRGSTRYDQSKCTILYSTNSGSRRHCEIQTTFCTRTCAALRIAIECKSSD